MFKDKHDIEPDHESGRNNRIKKDKQKQRQYDQVRQQMKIELIPDNSDPIIRLCGDNLPGAEGIKIESDEIQAEDDG